MAYQIVCDVCETTFTRHTWAGLHMVVPAHLLGDTDVGDSEVDVCSWDCLRDLANYFLDEPEEPDDLPPPVLERVLAGDEDEEAQLVLERREGEPPPQPKLVSIPVANLKVDGRSVD